MRAVRIKVTGRVQGVFFRWSARREADKRGVTGWIMNDRDGSVAVFAQGEDDGVEAFIEWCRSGPKYAKVAEVIIEEAKPESIDGFSIR